MKPFNAFIRPQHRFFLYACIGLWTSAFVATHVPMSPQGEVFPSDKTLHFLGYLVLGGILLATAKAYRVKRIKRIPAVICVTLLYAAFDEITQPFVGRSAERADWIADACGALTGIAVVEVFVFLRKRRAGIRNST